MKLIITIDTEEDQWGSFKPTGHTVENIRQIPKLQALFDEFGVTPTYLINYPVATDENAIKILSNIAKDERCEIGSHCHPWNTPPYSEITNEENSMIRNLPSDLQYEKLKCLHETIKTNFGITPVSFRSGRWGYSQEVANNLYKLGYKIDTSITPYISWKQYYGADYSYISPDPFRLKCGVQGDSKNRGDTTLLHIPATVGYLRSDFKLSNRIYQVASKPGMRKFRLLGLLEKLKLVEQVVLSPEINSASQMIALTKIMQRKEVRYVNLFFHSTTLMVGATEYVRTSEDEAAFYGKMRAYLEYIKESNIESIMLCDTQRLLRHTEIEIKEQILI